MRPITQPRYRYVIGVLAFLAVGACATGNKGGEDMVIYFRDAELTELSDQDQEVFLNVDAGESTRIERAFPDAPPQIPHSVVDMLPIMTGDNECVDCHHPDNVTSESDMPIPKTHFSHAVMGSGGKDDPMVWVVTGYEETDDVAGTRYNCTICHLPQATNVDTPDTTFITLERGSAK